MSVIDINSDSALHYTSSDEDRNEFAPTSPAPAPTFAQPQIDNSDNDVTNNDVTNNDVVNNDVVNDDDIASISSINTEDEVIPNLITEAIIPPGNRGYSIRYI